MNMIAKNHIRDALRGRPGLPTAGATESVWADNSWLKLSSFITARNHVVDIEKSERRPTSLGLICGTARCGLPSSKSRLGGLLRSRRSHADTLMTKGFA
jgi:hypothetical protein